MNKKWLRLLQDYDGQTKGTVVQLSEADAAVLIRAKIGEDAGTGPEESGVRAALGELRAELKEATDGIVADIRAAATAARVPRVELVEAEADKTRSAGDFLQCVVQYQRGADQVAGERLQKVYRSGWVFDDTDKAVDVYKAPIARRLQEGSGTNGGFRVPEEFETSLFSVKSEENSFAEKVMKVPMGAPVKSRPALRQTTNPTPGQTAMVAGVKVYRKSEKAQRTASEPQLDMIRWEATDLIGYTEFTRDLIADAAGFQTDVQQLFSTALNWKREYEFLRADGVGKPLGVFNSPALIKVTRNTANKILFEDIVAMQAALWGPSWATAEWWGNVTAFPQIAAIKDAAGNNLFFSSGNAGVTGAPSGYLLGRKINWTEKVPTLGTTGDLGLYDPQAYGEGVRAGIEVGVSEDFLFDTDGVAFRVKMRNDGQTMLRGTIKQADGSNTAVSPLVQLN